MNFATFVFGTSMECLRSSNKCLICECKWTSLDLKLPGQKVILNMFTTVNYLLVTVYIFHTILLCNYNNNKKQYKSY